MGAEFQTMKLDGKLSHEEVKAAFEKEQEADRYENGHSYSGGLGMANGLEFPSKEFTRVDDAEAWLQEHCQKWEAAKCVVIATEEKRQWLIAAWCSS